MTASQNVPAEIESEDDAVERIMQESIGHLPDISFLSDGAVKRTGSDVLEEVKQRVEVSLDFFLTGIQKIFKNIFPLHQVARNHDVIFTA